MANGEEEQPIVFTLIDQIEILKSRIAQRQEEAFAARETFIQKTLMDLERQEKEIDTSPQFSTALAIPALGSGASPPITGEQARDDGESLVRGPGDYYIQPGLRKKELEIDTFNWNGGIYRTNADGSATLLYGPFTLPRQLTFEQATNPQMGRDVLTGSLPQITPPIKSQFCGLARNTPVDLINGDRGRIVNVSASDSCVYTFKNETRDTVQVITSGDIREIIGTPESDIQILTKKYEQYPTIAAAIAAGRSIQYDTTSDPNFAIPLIIEPDGTRTRREDAKIPIADFQRL